MRIRPEAETDRAAIPVNKAAFDTSLEADLVESLRGKGMLSFARRHRLGSRQRRVGVL
jgi:hypothetical protein